jgi:flagellar basal-body rod protein FlgG
MIKGLFTSATGLATQTAFLDVTANNLANINTTAFKRSQPAFEDLIYITARVPGSDISQGFQVPTGLQFGSGSVLSGTNKIFIEGVLINTGAPFNVAIDGEGFFQVTLPNGDLRYTRDGTLALNSTGNIVTQDGFTINPPITIPQDATSVAIGTDGTVTVTEPGSPTPVQVGQLQLVRFVNPPGLSSEGRNLYAETASSGTPIIGPPGQQGNGFIRQGFLEGSNVSAVNELINLILAQRAFEFNTRAVRTADDMLSFTNNLTR